MLLTNALNSIQ